MRPHTGWFPFAALAAGLVAFGTIGAVSAGEPSERGPQVTDLTAGSHGYVVLDTAGAVATDNLRAAPPVPPLLLYEPSAESRPADWIDFDGPDDPYRLVGWAYVAPCTFGSEPPQRRCIAPSEWFVHEAGWHLKDGGMYLTPGATTEPPRPAGLAIHMWHPRVWDLHVWRGEQGVPTVSFANPGERHGGKVLPKESFFHFLSGYARAPRGWSR